MRDEVTVEMAASPDRVWALVSDVTQIGRFSPETLAAEWIPPATGPEVGARFRGRVRRNEKGPTYWTTCQVVACEPGREFAFGVGLPRGDGFRILNTWRYVLEATDDGTAVTESFELTPTAAFRLYWMVLGRFRGRRNRNDMRRTLERMRDALEHEAG